MLKTFSNRTRKGSLLLATLLLVLGLPSCGGGGNALAPQFQPEVSNLTDNFQFQTTGIQDITQNLQYTWQNTGIAANINQASAVAGGTAILTIRDSAGVSVYSADLINNGSFVSATGATGNWTIQVSLTNVSGTLNFRVQKRP